MTQCGLIEAEPEKHYKPSLRRRYLDLATLETHKPPDETFLLKKIQVAWVIWWKSAWIGADLSKGHSDLKRSFFCKGHSFSLVEHPFLNPLWYRKCVPAPSYGRCRSKTNALLTQSCKLSLWECDCLSLHSLYCFFLGVFEVRRFTPFDGPCWEWVQPAWLLGWSLPDTFWPVLELGHFDKTEIFWGGAKSGPLVGSNGNFFSEIWTDP